MGLDGVELLMAVEDAFQIHIEDAEAEKTLTVGDLYNLVLTKLENTNNKTCLTSAAFYRLRQAIVKVSTYERRAINPSTSLHSLLPKESRREKWSRIQHEVTLDLPDLHLPEWVFLCFAGTGLLLPIIIGLYFHCGLEWYFITPVPGVLAGMLFYGLIVVPLTKPLALEFPYGCQTIGGLAQELRDHNFGKLSKELGGWNKDEVLKVVRRLIVKQLGVEESRLELNARFVDDLGMN